jgi:large subunit ribosomal protein L10
MRTREQKQTEIEALRDCIARAQSVLVADYRGLTVDEANDLRTKLRQVGEGQVEYRVAKNRLVRLAVKGTPSEVLEPYLIGPTALAIAFEEPTAMAKALVDYAKQNEKLEIKGGIVEGDVVDLDAVRRLAALPSREELYSMLMSTLQSPMQNLAGTLQSLLGNLRNVLDRRQEQLEA